MENAASVSFDVLFEPADVEAFARLSRDRNPLHVDPDYGRRSSFGTCIVHGAIGALAALERVAPAAPVRVTRLSASFRGPMFVGRRYGCRIDSQDDNGHTVTLCDGALALMQLAVSWAPADVLADAVETVEAVDAAEVDDHADDALAAGVERIGEYQPTGLGARYPRALRAFGAAVLDTIALCSFLTGMKLPGRRALFSALSLTFERRDAAGALAYRHAVTSFNRDFGLLDTRLEVRDAHAALAHGELRSFVRKSLIDHPVAHYLAARSDVGATRLAGKVAFVTGGSRGLGAALVRSLAALGCRVYLNYLGSTAQASAVVGDLEAHGLAVTPVRGDAGDRDWLDTVAADLRARHARLDVLVCNACEPPLRMEDEASSAARRDDYLARNLRLVEAPLEAFADLLAASEGIGVAISSEMVDTAPAGYAHYVELKRRTEACMRRLADAQPSIRTLIARPSNLLTEMSNTPTRILNAQAPDEAAMRIVNTLTAGGERHRLLARCTDDAAPRAKATLMVSASFTLDAMLGEFDAWLACLPGEHAVRQTGYNRMMQDLLSPDSALNTAEGTVNLLYLRVSDWLREREACWRDDGVRLSDETDFVRRVADDFLAALLGFAQRSRAWQLLIVCPEPRLDPADAQGAALLDAVHARLRALPGELPNLATVFACDYHATHGIDATRIDDASRNRIAHIPYVQGYFGFLAALAVRMLNAKRQPPAKVVVLDCDNTLWRGVCGEEGDVRQLVIDDELRAFQQSMKALLARGFVLCLCSKNREEDVWDVFDRHPGMVLTREDIAAAKINWLPKSENLRALAEELDLGMNSFVFFDDNPLECAEVRAGAPEVLTVCTTQGGIRPSEWAERLWVFDRLAHTREDGARTRMYREQSERERFRQSAESFRAFIDGLNLDVAIEPVTAARVDRASQMTLRTNQFNNTTIRRDRAGIVAMMHDDAWRLLMIDVVDRFGDYGTTGLVAYRIESSCLYVDAFLLSCRVLGRTVEDRVMQRLVALAQQHGVEQIQVAFAPTRRNTPFRQFLDKLAPSAILADPAALGETSRYVFEREALRETLDRQAYLEHSPRPGADDARAAPPFVVSADNRAQGTDYVGIAQRLHLVCDALGPSGDSTSDAVPGVARASATDVAAQRSAGSTGIASGTEREAALLREVKLCYARVLAIDPDTLSESEELERYGLESIDVVNLTVELERLVPGLAPTFLFEHRTLRDVVRALIAEYGAAASGLAPAPAATPSSESAHPERRDAHDVPDAHEADETRDEIAIIGLHGIYPGASDMHVFWQLLQAGESRIGPMPDARRQLIDRALPGVAATLHGHMDRAGYLDGIERFEADLFGITPKEAELMDPQQRLFLQVVWGLLEDAGYTRHTLERATGVFVGVLSNDYAMYANLHALRQPEQYRHTDYYQIANRVSYHFDLSGPSMSIDAACASSGTAFHLACRAIRHGDCEAAIVGGVNLILHPSRLIQYTQTGMLSGRGSCTPFGRDADGTLLGEGVGAVLLKPLSRALADGDNIYAVVKASSVNSGGKTNGFTVPNPNAQASLIAGALRAARVPAARIAYVEAHGTGTALGDPIEVSALGRAFRELGATGERRIGSVKANVGHGESNAFLASLSKVLLQFRHRRWVPTPTSAEDNAAIDFAAAGFAVQRTLADWSETGDEGPVAACISNFGAGGSNAHVVLQAWPTSVAQDCAGRHLVLLSTHRPALLPRLAGRLRERLLRDAAAEIDLGALAYTLQVGRQHLDHRVVFLVDDRDMLLDALERFQGGAAADARWLCGSTASRNVLGDFLDGQADMRELLRKWAREHEHHRIAQLWLHGFSIPWEELHAARKPVRISLPTYPFDGRPHWLEHGEAVPGLAAAAAMPADDAVLFAPVWARADLSAASKSVPSAMARHVLFCGLDADAREAVRAASGASDTTVHFLALSAGPRADAYADHAVALSAWLRERLRGGLREPLRVQITAAGAQDEVWAGLAALLKSAMQENPMLSAQLIEFDDAPDATAWFAILNDEMREGRDVLVRYRPERHVRAWHPLAPPARPAAATGGAGVYLITGGSGALALQCAEWLGTRDRGATIVLLARRDEAALAHSPRAHRLAALREAGTRIVYRSVDVCDGQALEDCVATIVASHGPLRGVLHCAGTLRDTYLIHKSEDDFRAVLSSKVAGTLNLDRATRGQPLAFFALFSSISGVLGNAGQADYAAANAFMDAFAHRRAARVRAGERAGHSVSINWPLWRDGGMALDAELAALLREHHGLDAITSEVGMRALDRALAGDAQQVFVGTGAGEAVARTLAASARRPPDTIAGAPATASTGAAPSPAALYPYLKRVLADATKLDPATIDEHRPLADLGLDSILLAKLNKVLAANFRQLPRTLFYEYPTLEALAAYLAEQIRLQGIPADRFVPVRAEAQPPLPARAAHDVAPASAAVRAPEDAAPATRHGDAARDVPIAIIGIGGRYPNAPSFDALWRSLKNASSEIGELPVRRWHGPHADAGRDLHPALRGRKGAFLDDFAQFDPAFFQIAPVDVHAIDPQERMVLMSCWAALESSGYTRERIAARHGRNVAVCVGATKSGFNHFSSGAAAHADGGVGAREAVTSTSFANMANRVSYFLDLCGPSIAFDTMCTSSLTAIHHACQYLRQGEAELAIAAGVNLHLHPNDYLALERLGMLSNEADVNCFSLGGNGFIPGEAVGAVVLKRLDAALADGDRIDAVIAATGLSHSGHTHGYTAPSLAQQEALIRRVIERAGRRVDEIAYVESAANGSSMGDAIEWGALKNVFRTRAQPCAIGSVKPNLGHPEAAAGMAQLSKVVAQLRHRAFAPTLVDPARLDHALLADSGLRLVTAYEPWPEQGDASACLITAAGAGGTYAAMVVERAPAIGAPPAARAAVVAIALSARAGDALRRMAAELHDHLAAYPELRIEDVARTLHMGREAMAVRTGCVVESRRELMSWLREFASGESPASARTAEPQAPASAASPLRARLDEALQAWLAAREVDWPAAYGDTWAAMRVAPLALPAYPFDTREFWRETARARRADEREAAGIEAVSTAAGTAAPSPIARSAPGCAAPDETAAEVKGAIRTLLHVEPTEAIDDATFFELGIDSIRMVSFVSEIAARLALPLEETVLFDCPTVAQFCAHVARLRAASNSPDGRDAASAAPAGAGAAAPTARHALAAAPAARADRASVAAALPDDDGAVLRQLKAVVRTVLDYSDSERFDDDATFFELGVDSIRMVGFVAALSARLDLELEETVLFDHPTLAALAGYVAAQRRSRGGAQGVAAAATVETPANAVEAAAAARQSPPLDHAALLDNLRRHGRAYEEMVPLQTEGDGPLLFCLHPASGDVAMFGKLAAAVGTRCRMVGIKARGFLTRQPACADAYEMARRHAEIIQAVDPVGPYHVMGASMGGVVAYEVARVLQNAGRRVSSVFMLETPLITCERDSDIFALDELQNWLTNANFLMIAMLHLDPAFRQRKQDGLVKWDDLVITAPELGLDEDAARDEERLESRLVALIVGRGVRQAPQILGMRLRSMSGTHRNNLRCMREYRWQPLARPDEVEILMFRTASARAISDQVYNPNYLHKLQRVHGSMIPLLDAWVERMPQVRTVVVGGADHFDLCNRTIGDEEVIGPVLASMRRRPVAQLAVAAVAAGGAATAGPGDSNAPNVPNALIRPNASNASAGAASDALRVAVIGISARFPGAGDVDAFWRVLAEGKSLIGPVPAGRFAPRDGAPDHGCLFERIDEFDHAFFHLSPNEAQMMEPAERMFLEEAWHAVEDAGLVPDRLAGANWGVFAGSGGDYDLHVQSVLGIAPQVSASTLPGRVAYHLNLHGPVMAIDAGCASSLLAVGQACDSLRLGQCEIAIAGGAMVYSTRNLIAAGHYYRLLSETERGAALGADATGMLPGEAVGALVLKPLQDAVRDGDRVYAVLDAWGNAHNGRTQGIAAPSAASQAALLTSVYRRFGIDPASLDFLEANASGSPLGDKVELQGLRTVFGGRAVGRPLALGTVENNVGHSFAASGIAHLLKVVLALHRDTLPPTANVDAAAAAAGADGGPFEIPARARPWPRRAGAVRRAGVSSYSATGINAHLVVSEAPPAAVPTPAAGPALLAFSAPTPEALRQRGRDLLAYVRAADDRSWAPAWLSANLLLRRHQFRHRCALIARDRAHAEQLLGRFVANASDPEVLTNLAGAASNDDEIHAALRAEAAAFDAGRAPLPLERAAHWYMQDIAFDARRGFASADRVPLSLPGYPFARTRHWLREAPASGPDMAAQPAGEDTQRWLLRQVATITGEAADAVSAEANWSEMGFDSLMSLRLLSAIRERTGVEVPLVELLDRRTPAVLHAHLEALGAFAAAQGDGVTRADAPPLPAVQYPWFGERLSALRATEEVVVVALAQQAPALAPASRQARDRVLAELLDAGIAVFRDADQAVLLAARSVGIDAHLRRFEPDALAAGLGALAPGQLWAPLSQEQARHLHLTERMGNTAWNVFHVFRLYAAEVDVERLRHALILLARQQDLLRTRYVAVGDGHAQCVSELVGVSLDSISTRSREDFHQFIQSRRSHALLDEHGGPAVRIWLTEVDGAFHLGLVAHHAHADAFTPGLLFSQLMALYGALGGEAAARDDDWRQPDQYWLYALRQHDARGAGADTHRAWWRDALAGADLEMRLPYRQDVVSPSSPSRELAENQIVPVPPALGDRIAELGRAHGISYPQLFAAVLAIVLREFFGNDRPVLQVIHNQRDSAALAACLGDFSNVAFVPFEFDADRSVIDTLHAVRRTLLTALQHARIPAADLLRIAGVDGEAGCGAMVGDVVFDSADIDTARVSIAGEHGVSTYMDAVLEQRRIHFLDQPLASLFFQFLRIDGRLYIFHAYRRALFEHETMQKLPLRIVELADAMLRAPDAPVAGLVASFAPRFDELGRGVHAPAARMAPASEAGRDTASGAQGEASDLLERFLGGDLSIAQLRSTLRASGVHDGMGAVAE
ncbi:HAD family hydrolase [Burkholderia savannae]|uniref:HAD family hydrolase n=1 Tax=Burkholderia savannae TaxID=1637837 RepID=A0ABR5T8U3_9BURK|nr:SDR family NAD(P)-dependent oxidoreductase [Burkholderia savannae]KWZ39932.1 HAD family hydrolase [Burkholderia savannae]